uniref:Uncharacterized protein n=1 Tax=Rhizophora mucronata TaxID=61149 RepID=A0A2P2PD08_RHIMU
MVERTKMRNRKTCLELVPVSVYQLYMLKKQAI